MNRKLPPDVTSRPLSSATKLRRDAEARLQKQTANAAPLSDYEKHKLHHELEVHQIELEMQNEELRNAQHAAETGAARYTDLYDFSPIGLVSLRPDGTIRQSNLSAACLLGKERAKLVGARFDSFVALSNRHAFNDFLLQVFDSEDKKTCELQLEDETEHCETTKEEPAPCTVIIEATRSADGQECRTSLMDVSEWVASENKLRESEERYAFAMQGANDGIWDWNLITNEVHYSPRWKSMLGYAENEIKDEFSEWERLVHPDDIHTAVSNVQAFINNDVDKLEFEFRMQHKDGHYINILSRAFAAEDEAGKITRMVGTHVDITGRKQMESRLQNSEKKYRAIFETSQVGMALCKMDGTIIDVNQGYLDIIGYSKEEALKLSYWDITPRSYEAEEMKQLQTIKDTGKYGPYEKEYICKDGHTVPVLLNGSLINVEDNIDCIWSLVHDMTDIKKAGEKLSYQATHDGLTGLINRREFERRTERLLATSKEHSQHHALCFMDLDQFKVVNDTCGHAAGDELLRQLSTVLEEVIRHRDTLARLGGDEFGILMEHCSLDDAHRVATLIQTAIQDYQFIWEGHSFRIGVSMGLVPIRDTALNITELLKDADTACYLAKDKGRNRIHVHGAEDTDLAQRQGEMQWVTRIQYALDENRFCLYAQAIQSLDNPTDVHYELLIRMLDEQGEIIPPGAFLSAAERYNLVTQVDRWVIENAFRLLIDNPAFQHHINFISINLSGQSLTNETFLDFVVTQLQDSGIDSSKICFEITETAAIANLSTAMKFISTLKGLGCRFALDDFGSGLSSFGYLKNLPVDFLKIDGIFVKDIVDDPIDHAMVKSINEIGQVMGMQTIAEFVENDEIKGMLREIGVNYAQGYGIHKPQPFEELLNRSNNVTDINKSKDDETKS